MQLPFFVNIFPTNDRRLPTDYRKLLREFVSQTQNCLIDHTLFTVGDKRMDPWILSQAALELGDSMSPIIAINPAYVHPIEIAKRLSALANLYPNRLSLNLVTGSFFKEMESIGDNLSFKDRSKRLLDFYHILSQIIYGSALEFKSDFYSVLGSQIWPTLSSSQKIKFFVSGGLADDMPNSSDVFFLRNLKPQDENIRLARTGMGLALGLCVREMSEDAIDALKRIYPEDRRGQMLFEMTIKNHDTPWNRWVSSYLSDGKADEDRFFNLTPMRNYWSAAPFVVASYDEAAAKLFELWKLGYSYFVLDYQMAESLHVNEVLKRFFVLADANLSAEI